MKNPRLNSLAVESTSQVNETPYQRNVRGLVMQELPMILEEIRLKAGKALSFVESVKALKATKPYIGRSKEAKANKELLAKAIESYAAKGKKDEWEWVLSRATVQMKSKKINFDKRQDNKKVPAGKLTAYCTYYGLVREDFPSFIKDYSQNTYYPANNVRVKVTTDLDMTVTNNKIVGKVIEGYKVAISFAYADVKFNDYQQTPDTKSTGKKTK